MSIHRVHFRVSVCRKYVDDIPVWTPEEDGHGNVLMFQTPTEAIQHARIVHKTTTKPVVVHHYLSGEQTRFWAISETGHVIQEGRRTQQYRPNILCDCFESKVLYCKHRMIADSYPTMKKVEAA